MGFRHTVLALGYPMHHQKKGMLVQGGEDPRLQKITCKNKDLVDGASNILH